MPSIIQAIKDAILTEISSDVRIQDRSFWSQLLEEKKKDHDPSAWSMRWKVRTDKPFIVTRFLFRCLYNILLCFIWLCNVIYEFIFRGFSGRWRGYSKEESKDIKGRDIFRKGIRPSAGINIILAGLALVAGIVAIVYIIVFNISNVVLAPSNLRTNTNGIFSIDQPGFETQHYFLLNAANFWTPTGIALSEGDKVYITASGSMYGDKSNTVIFDNSLLHRLVPTFQQKRTFDQCARESIAYFLSHPELQVEDPGFDAFSDAMVEIMENAAEKVRAL